MEYKVVGENLGLAGFRYGGLVEGDGIVELETVVGRLIEEREGERGVLGLAGGVDEGVGTLTDPPNRHVSLLWSTFLGGYDNDRGMSLVLDASMNPVVAGATHSRTFPQFQVPMIQHKTVGQMSSLRSSPCFPNFRVMRGRYQKVSSEIRSMRSEIQSIACPRDGSL